MLCFLIKFLGLICHYLRLLSSIYVYGWWLLQLNRLVKIESCWVFLQRHIVLFVYR
ncbi:hypothetical protein ERO13_D02G078500v2 [Gossypium hirsutum]|uniref:Uncharacterized protein n=2 Tax=Gossypium TaxID=3633 RepID=A0A5D2LV98_GOSTO|nr:hypothetical protein ERO13_D02G078500v2 [Gossypium hirsutum]TYG78877.1 hypothetical protein ES288_D02G096400v1 [Gossypium darwinii]TYH82990.1 hypothetical protein ES332_D02G100700v1 [Gossypium tomentosum]